MTAPGTWHSRRTRAGVLAIEQLEDRTVPSALAIGPPGGPPTPAGPLAWMRPAGLAGDPGSGLFAPADHDHEHGLEVLYIPEQFDLTDVTGGFLTGPNAGDPLAVARDFLAARAADMGLLPADVADAGVVTNYATAATGVTHLGFRQTLNGLPVKNTNIAINVTADGRVINAAGYFVPAVGRFAGPVAPALDAAAAVRAAAAQLDLVADGPVKVLTDTGGANRAQTLTAPGVSTEDVPAALVYVATPGGAELAWELEIQTPDREHWYDLAVSAATGEILYANDYVHNADYNAYPQPVESPIHGSRAVRTDPWVFTPAPAAVPSPFGWHDTNGVAGAEFTITRGNNVSAYTDTNNDNQPDAGSQPDGGASLAFNFPVDLTQAPSTYRPAAVTNLFYWNNYLHDVHYLYGFDEAARNFQVNNYGRGGAGNDAVNAEAQDGGGLNNANFATPPDGSAPRMQMYLWSGTPQRDGDFDNGIIVHEYGHGVSNRLTNNGSGLGATQSGGMGEGWSDWWALMLTQQSASETTAGRGIGTYALGQPTTGVGIRSYRYDFDIGSQPNETFLAYGTGSGQSTQVHWAGTRWASALWDITHLLIQNYGYEPNLYNSTSTAGNIRALHLVMNGLKLQPSNPSFTQARNAILQADQTLYGGANQLALWTAFARRGLGANAATASSSATSITTDFTIPPAVLGLSVTSTNPLTGSTVAAPPASYLVSFSRDVDTATLQASDFTVNNAPATGVSYDAANRRATFSFASDPVTGQGLQTMAIAAGSIVSTTSDNVLAFTGQFRYDAVALAVTGTTPPANGTIPIDSGSAVVRVNFNEPVNPSSVAAADFSVTTGTVTGVAVVPGNQAADVTIGNLTTEGTLTLTVAANAITDAAGGGGNPAGFTATYQLDFTTRTFPTPAAVNPLGSRVYAATSPTGVINAAGDVDSFTVNLDAGQAATVIVRPTSAALRPTVELFGPSGASVGGPATATAANVPVAVTRAITGAGSHRVAVSAAAGTGNYTVEVLLNAATELEALLGTPNDTPAAAQSLDPAAVTESTAPASAVRTAVRGASQATTAGYAASAVAPTFTDISTTGTRSTAAVGDDATDTITAAQLGGFTFPFYGTTYTSVSFSTNALITFGGATTAYTNGDLNGSPSQATVAALWDDLNIDNTGTGTAARAVFWQVVGSAPNQQLIVQWNNVRQLGGSTYFTLQAVLSANGNVQLNYGPAIPSVAVQSATVGVKAAGTSNPSRLLVSFNQNPGPLVGSNLSTLIAPTTGTLIPDFYSFAAAAGDAATVAVQNLAAGNVDVQLLGTDGTTVLASGAAGATNLNEAIQNFPLPAAGTYFVRVTGGSGVPYNLVVARRAAFDAEANNTAAAAQPLGASPAAVGSVAAGEADWYSVTLPAGATGLRAETATPGDGPGQFANALNPRVEVFDAAGTTLLGAGAALADGRNEAVAVGNLTPGGTYLVRLTGEGSTAGEYLLGVSPVAGPQQLGVLVNGTTAPSPAFTASRLTSLVVSFDAAVSAVDPGAFTLTNGSLTLASGGGIAVGGLGTAALTLTFTGGAGVQFGSLADGVWTLTTDNAKVRNGQGVAGAGATTVNHIRRLFGDFDGNGTVNLDDLTVFSSTFGLTSADAGFVPALDFTNDGQINLDDLTEFSSRFGTTL